MSDQTCQTSAELAFASILERQLEVCSQKKGAISTKLLNKVQGLSNNCRGLAAELAVAKAVPGVTGLSQAFPSSPKGTLLFHQSQAPE